MFYFSNSKILQEKLLLQKIIFMKTFFSAVTFLLFLTGSLIGQDKQYKIAGIGFYNLENLFDTEKDTSIFDAEFTPTGKKNWTPDLYQKKLANMAHVIAQIGLETTPDGLAALGVSEIENRKVLEDLVAEPAIASRNYQIVHYDSPDRRGIDVAFLYNPKYFTLRGSKPFPLMLYREDSSRVYTRDVLLVSGTLDGDLIHVLVNHWPSRSGGEKASRPRRNAAADLCKRIIDSLLSEDQEARIILMGDLNDDPVSPSVKKHLAAKGDKELVRRGDLFNPMMDYYRKGLGTLAYRDAWSLFDMIIISAGLLSNEDEGFQFYQTGIFNPAWLLQKTGQFRGYPFRTFGGDTFLGGYSDHFPVYAFFVKPIK